MTVSGRSTPSKCSCRRTLGRLRNNSLSSLMESASVRQGTPFKASAKPCKIIYRPRSEFFRVVQSDLTLRKDRTHDANRRAFTDHGLWFASRDSFSDGDAGAIRLDHGSHDHACGPHSAGL